MPPELGAELEVLRGAPGRWVVASHMNPDGDTLGSAIAMKQLLRALGHDVLHLCPDPVPELYAFMPGASDVFTELPASFDGGLVTLDAADLNRFGGLQASLQRLGPIVNVDHHVSNPRFGDVNLVLEDAAATGEVVYRLFKHFGVPLDLESAHGMYVALLMDTGRFSYEATSAASFEMAAELVRAGVRPDLVARHLYEEVPMPEFRIKGLGFERMQTAAGGRIAYTVLTRSMLEEAGARDEHTDGLSEALRALKGVEISFFLRETPAGDFKASMRSKSQANVAQVAMRFGGGGHRRAAGCNLPKPAAQAVATLLAALEATLR